MFMTRYKLNGKVVTKYIAPIEELVRIYQIYRLEGHVNYRIVKRDFKRITKDLAMEVVNFLEKEQVWCGGWDLNPRRPTPSGPEPDSPLSQAWSFLRRVNYDYRYGVRDNHVLDRFLEWCIGKGTSESTCTQYTRYLSKPLNMNNKWSRLAWKQFFKFLGKEDLWKQLKVKRSNVDLYIPSDQEVMEALNKACRTSEKLCWTYKLLVYSGLRLVEVTRVLNNYDDDKWIKQDGFYKYPLSWKRGAKQVFYMYTLEKPPRIHVSDKWISNWTSKNKLLPAKYIRKWVATKMLSVGIPEEIVNFIQGRIPQEILSKHYLKLSVLADKYYPKYKEVLGRMIFSRKT